MRLATWCRLLALAALLVFVFARPASAAAAPPADAHSAPDAHGHGEKKGGLDFTGIKRYDLGIYTLIVFGLLMFIVGKFAWPNIRAGLAKREANIGGLIADAKRDREEAATKLAEANKQLAEAASQAKAILDEARKDADALKVAEREVGVKDAQAERERVRRDLAIEKDAVGKELHQQVVELATLIATKAVRRQVTIDTKSELVDESIAELKANANRA